MLYLKVLSILRAKQNVCLVSFAVVVSCWTAKCTMNILVPDSNIRITKNDIGLIIDDRIFIRQILVYFTVA